MIKNLIGQKFERLTVISRETSSKEGRAMWLCQYDCGSKCIVKGKYLLNGDTKNCGCLNLERIKQQGLDNKNPNRYEIKNNVVYIYFHNSDEYFICDLKDLEYIKQTTPLGNFRNKEDAVTARKQAEEKYFGEYKRINAS